MTNDRLLSDTRRIIPTLRACIIELFILVFTIHLSAGGKRGLLTNIHALQIAAHETSASHSNGRIIYWKLGNFWVAVNDGRNAASYASPLVSGQFSSALFFFPIRRDLFASKDPLDPTTVGVVGDFPVFFSPFRLSPISLSFLSQFSECCLDFDIYDRRTDFTISSIFQVLGNKLAVEKLAFCSRLKWHLKFPKLNPITFS